METDKTNLEKYLEDISTIKKLMVKYEESPIIENWAFYTWGILIIAATTLQLLIYGPAGQPGDTHYLYIWVPCLILGGTFETIAWLRYVNKTDTSLGSRKLIKIYISMIIALVAVSFLLFFTLNLTHQLSGVLLISFSVAISFLAQASFGSLFVESAITLVLGIVLMLFSLKDPVINFFSGYYIGAIMIVMGIHTGKLAAINKE